MALTLVSTINLTTATDTIEWTNIPQTGKDLLILLEARSDGDYGTGAAIDSGIRFNSTSSNLVRIFFTSSIPSVLAEFTSYPNSSLITDSNTTANTFSNSKFYVSNYTAATHKTFAAETATQDNANGNWPRLALNIGTWENNAAITAVSIQPLAYNFVANTTGYLYIVS